MYPSQACAVILAALEGVALTADEINSFQDLPPAGFTLFRRNLPNSFSEVRDLCNSLQGVRTASAASLILAIDQEGGRVARLRAPFPDVGPALDRVEGRTDNEALLTIENQAFIAGSALAALGLNVNFAPVLDVLSNENNVAIGDRCFGRDAESVQKRAGAYLKGLQSSGVLGCLKHFPGQGDAGADTHLQGTVIQASLESLHRRELVPFLGLMQACPMIMISHAVYPAIDPHQPASLSEAMMQGFLRRKLNYQGLVVTDDMNMKAIGQDQKTWCAAVVQSVAAGADLVLVCRELERYVWAAEALAREAQKSPSFTLRLTEAINRTLALRARL